ncbi:MAG: GGDEF domain-containing protein [Bryobacteraceae bacterium]
MIAAFFRNDTRFGDVQGPQLGFWCNIAALALERRRLHDQLSYRAQHNGLTGLPNRALFYERLEGEIERASHGGGLLGVLYLDLDGFKQINDTYGHATGDVVLRETAKRMTQGVRRGDTVARIGGDEFVVLLPMLGRIEDAEQIADKIAKALREPIYANQQRLFGRGVRRYRYRAAKRRPAGSFAKIRGRADACGKETATVRRAGQSRRNRLWRRCLPPASLSDPTKYLVTQRNYSRPLGPSSSCATYRNSARPRDCCASAYSSAE